VHDRYTVGSGHPAQATGRRANPHSFDFVDERPHERSVTHDTALEFHRQNRGIAAGEKVGETGPLLVVECGHENQTATSPSAIW
jgi:hypothetical protein